MPRFLGASLGADLIWQLIGEGKGYVAGDADANDTVTGQTSFATTTPTFLVSVQSGWTCIPLWVDLSQTGGVAGGDIELVIEIDNANRYSSGGTEETRFNLRTDKANSTDSDDIAVYSGATATNAFGQRVFSADIAADVSPAEGILPGPLWVPSVPYMLVGPASLLVFTSAGTTGPTWLWSIGYLQLRTADLPW
jgi:hypothetical protein